jgi:hypothetical protein
MSTVINFPDNVDQELADTVASIFHDDVYMDEGELVTIINTHGFEVTDISYVDDTATITVK